MARHTAPAQDPLRDLNPKQRIALGELAAGATQQQAADKAGVQRTTVSGWANHHPGFRAALDSQLLAANDDLLSMRQAGSTLAVEGLLKRIKEGDEGAAEFWIRHIGVAPIPANAIGPTDPDEIIDRKIDELVERDAQEASRRHLEGLWPGGSTDRDEIAAELEEELNGRIDGLDDAPADPSANGSTP